MARSGYWHRHKHRHRAQRAELIAALGLLSVAVASPAAAASRPVAIGATTLDAALTLLAQQTGTEIISTEPGLRNVRVAPLTGRLPVREALERLLRDTGYRAVSAGGGAYRIVRGRTVDRQPPPARGASPAEPKPAEVVVTASKQRIPLLRFPGSLTILDQALGVGPARPSVDVEGVARTTPVLQTTALGPGRNKVFIRGVADSSFNGATQATASIYFGDVQLSYAGSEPGLRLYDVQNVEVMEGPQGTLYGAGAIGGVIRVTPHPVDLDTVSGQAAAGVSATAHGNPGFDLQGRLNVPVVRGVAGLRLLAYRERDGGYINDVGRGLANVNQVDIWGGRLSGRVDPGNGWTIDATALVQRIEGRDAQYAEMVGPLSRSTLTAQPFHGQYALGRLVITKNWDSGLQLVSATGASDQHTSDLYDTATAVRPAPGMPLVPVIYQTAGARTLLTQELRLSRSFDRGVSWVLGVTVLRNSDSEARTTGPRNDPIEIIGVTNVTQSASLFGESTLPLTDQLSATLGARLTYARIDSEPSITPRGADFIRGKSTRRLDPTAALSWRFAPRVSAFVRVQSGFRTGGLAVARGVGRVADFSSDSIVMGEVGLRLVRRGPTGLAASASASFAHWVDIQADLINRRGQPYTANIGNARIATLEGTLDYIPLPGLRLAGAFLLTSNRVSGDLADLSQPQNRRLPETPPLAGNASVTYEWGRAGETRWNVGGRVAYVGRSVLGVGDLLDISQGRYATVGLNGGWRRGPLAVSLAVENLANAANNRFAYGNPFTLISRGQTTPLRPFTVRLGLSRDW